MEELKSTEEMSSMHSSTFTHEMKSNLEPVIIVASINVEQILVDKLLFLLDVQKEFQIGRNPQANMDIWHPAISRNHCIVCFRDNKPIIKNLSSVGIYINKKLIKEKNETHFLKSGDEILLSTSYPDFILQFYGNISEIPPRLSKMLKQNSLLVGKKRKILHNSEQNVNISKKTKQDSPKKDERKQLLQGKSMLDEPVTERLSIPHHKYDSQVLPTCEESRHHHSMKEIAKKTEELRLKFNAEKNNIEADYAIQLKKLEDTCLKTKENYEMLKAENEKLSLQIFESEKRTEELTQKLEELERVRKESEECRSKLIVAEELIKLGKEELEKENTEKQHIIERSKQLEKMKEDTLKECLLEKEAMKRELTAKYESEIQSLHEAQIELEKKLVNQNDEKNLESESIINQLNDELDSVRQLLSIHETERQMLESEVQTKVKDFAEVLESEAQCTICSEIFVDAVTLIGCFHTFCQFCITEWKKQKQECPVCRQKILKNQEKRNFTFDSWIKSFISKMSPSMKSAREELIRIRALQIAQSAPNARASTVSAQTSAVRHATVQGAPHARAPTVSAQASAVRHAAVQGTAPRPSLAASHGRPHGPAAPVARARRPASRPRRSAPAEAPRATPTSALPPPPPANLSSFPLNALASIFQPLSASARNPYNFLNDVPIYIAGENEPLNIPVQHIAPINANPILISDEEDV